jgi:hypothetical protein
VRKAIAVLAALCALTFVGSAGAGISFGVSDDWAKFHPCGDVFWQSMRDIGYTQLRMTVQWDPASPGVIPAQEKIAAAVDCASRSNVSVVLAVYPAKPTAIGSNDAAQQSFARFVALVGQAFPGVKTFVVGNEPNVNRFWQPQFVNGQDAAAKDYEHTLAYAYDALKVARPDASVWGPAISSRGNDDASAKSNPSHSPVRFIAEMAAAYKASGRAKPIFDGFDMHPYPPVQDTSPFSKPFDWPQGGAGNLDRIERALWDGFVRTPQWPASVKSIPINLDEAGEQTDVKTSSHSGAYTYSSSENVTPIGESAQASNYTELAHIAECSGVVASLFYFPLIDDTNILGFQSGQLYADGAPKASYAALKQEIAASNGGQCHGGGSPISWYGTGVDGAAAQLVGPETKPTGTTRANLTVTADEDADYELMVEMRRPGSSSGPIFAYTGSVQAYHTVTVNVATAVFSWPVNGVTDVATFVLKAVANPARKTTLAPIAFGVATPPPPGPVTVPKVQVLVSGSVASFTSHDPKVLVRQIATLLALPNGGGLVQAATLLQQLSSVLGPMPQSGAISLNFLAYLDRSARTVFAEMKAKPKKAKLPSLKFTFAKGKRLRFPKLGRIPAGSYRMQIVLTGTSGAKLTLKTAPFSVDAKGRLKKLTVKAKPKKAKPAHKPKHRPKPKAKKKR